MSAVAVCCSSASFVSWNRRTFSIAMTAWSAKVWSSRSASGKGAPATAMASDRTPSRSSGRRAASESRAGRARSLPSGTLDRLRSADEPDRAPCDRTVPRMTATCRPVTHQACGAPPGGTLPIQARDQADASQAGRARTTASRRAARRSASWIDHPQDLGGGGLLIERLFRLVEQADVLDGDDGLGGEGLKESDLLVGERLDLHPADDDRPMETPLLSNGVLRKVRTPRAAAGLSGYSAATAARSWMCKVCWSITVRPPGDRRESGTDTLGMRPNTAAGCSMLFSTRMIIASFASQSRAAFSATAAMTGWRSVGELAITRRISAVAVCCSSDSVTCACAP